MMKVECNGDAGVVRDAAGRRMSFTFILHPSACIPASPDAAFERDSQELLRFQCELHRQLLE
ncbi:MAG: hypothetical protein KA761_11965, partial [Gemmatimonadaceae bacterium]|nr:hypothetical protein [Gemmatimonadaceae bacterium]